MTKDNASGAGMELSPLPEPVFLQGEAGRHSIRWPKGYTATTLEGYARAAQADATRLLAESQAELKGAYELLHHTEDRLMAAQARIAELERQLAQRSTSADPYGY